MNPTTSLLDRANLDRDAVRHQVARGLEGADDGELFLEYSQSEALMFDNGRLKQATYDTAQGFGLRAVKDDAVGYAHSSDVSLAALIRAADAVAAVRGGYSGTFAAAPARRNRGLDESFRYGLALSEQFRPGPSSRQRVDPAPRGMAGKQLSWMRPSDNGLI